MEFEKKCNVMFDAYIFDRSTYHICVYTYIIRILYYIFHLFIISGERYIIGERFLHYKYQTNKKFVVC